VAREETPARSGEMGFGVALRNGTSEDFPPDGGGFIWGLGGEIWDGAWVEQLRRLPSGGSGTVVGWI